MHKKLVLGLTGIRSDYDIMSSVYREIEIHPKLELKLIVTGAHLSESYGLTVQEIKKDGFKIEEEIVSLLDSDSAASRVKGLAIQLQGLVQAVTRVSPDFILVLGDREESIAAALVGAYINIPVAHIGGGDRVVGNVDDQIRHAVTKLSHIHFATNVESAERIIGLGEQSFRVFNTGNPGLDRFLTEPIIGLPEISDRIQFNLIEGEPFILMLQHVISSEIDQAYEQMKESLEAIKEIGIKTVIIHPNSDSGSHQLVRAIKEYESVPYISVQKNIPRLEFVNLMRNANCLVGNSSSGILEAPYLKLPVVNIGNRQSGRIHAENVQFVSHDKDAIISAVKRAVFDKEYRVQVAACHNPFGDGLASKQIASVLASLDINKKLLVKDNTF